MPRKNQEQPEVPPFEYRAGVTMPPIGGMYRRGDPSQIPPHRLHLGVNIRLADNEAGSRPGLIAVEGTTEDACITGIFEIEDFGVAIYITQLAKATLSGDPLTPNLDPTVTPFRIMAFNEERTPPEFNYWDAVATFAKKVPSPWRVTGVGDAFNTFQRMNGTLLIANGEDVYQAEFSEDDSVPRLDLSHLFSLPAAAAGNIVSTCVRRERVDDAQTGDEFEKDVLYMGCEGGEIWRYDGTTVELAYTLADGGRMQIIEWRGAGLVAAGDNAGGFCYQEQVGYAWTDVAWPSAFECNGLCEFNGEVVFVGGFEVGALSDAKAFNWDGSGAPSLLVTDTDPTLRIRYRTPVVAGGAVHFLKVADTAGVPTYVFISRFTDFLTGDDEWYDISATAGSIDTFSIGFFIAYAGAMLMLTADVDVEGEQEIVLVRSGAVADPEVIYNWPTIEDVVQLGPGNGYEAIPL